MAKGDNSFQELWRAMEMDSESQIEAALDKGALIDIRGPSGQTALMAAALNGHSMAIKALLRRGADWSLGENDGYASDSDRVLAGFLADRKAVLARGRVQALHRTSSPCMSVSRQHSSSPRRPGGAPCVHGEFLRDAEVRGPIEIY